MADVFINTKFSGGERHARRIAKMAELEHALHSSAKHVEAAK
jgi:ribose 5-phosphate isomerase RpiB